MTTTTNRHKFSISEDNVLKELTAIPDKYKNAAAIIWAKVTAAFNKRLQKKDPRKWQHIRKRWEEMNDVSLGDEKVADCPEDFVPDSPSSRNGMKVTYFSASDDTLLRYYMEKFTPVWSRAAKFMSKHTGVERTSYHIKLRWEQLNDNSFDIEQQRVLDKSKSKSQSKRCRYSIDHFSYTSARLLFVKTKIYQLVDDYYAQHGGSEEEGKPHWLDSLPSYLAPCFVVSLGEFLSRNPLRGAIEGAGISTSGPIGMHMGTDDAAQTFKDVDLNIGNDAAAFRVSALDASQIGTGGVDLVMNACAPVCCIAFSPHPVTGRNMCADTGSAQYLAVGTTRLGWLNSKDTPNDETEEAEWSPSAVEDVVAKLDTSVATDEQSAGGIRGLGCDQLYVMGDKMQHRHCNIIQMWKVCMGEDADGDKLSAQCLYGIGMDDCGPVWSMQWCPGPMLPDRHGRTNKPVVEGTIVGLLAVTCGSGVCIVYAVPHEHYIASTGVSGSGLNNFPVVLSSSLRRWEISTGVCCATWHVRPATNGAQSHAASTAPATSNAAVISLLCGHYDGSWTMWPFDLLASPTSATTAPAAAAVPANIGDKLCVKLTEPLRRFSDLQVRLWFCLFEVTLHQFVYVSYLSLSLSLLYLYICNLLCALLYSVVRQYAAIQQRHNLHCCLSLQS